MKNTIKVFRAMHDMTQEDLAEKARVTRRTINSIERGKYNPSLEVAFRIARAFDASVEEVFCYDDECGEEPEEE